MNKPFNNVYDGTRVLITGHTGFKGSWLTTWLINLGADVTGYSMDVPTKPSMFEILGLEKYINHISGDIRNENHLKSIFRKCKPEIVFHLAAQPLVRESYNDPLLTFETNVMGTVNLFESIRETKGVKALVNITSDKCYENMEWVYGYRESDQLGGHDPYSSSKACSEIITSSYRNSYFNPKNYGKSHDTILTTVRAGNVIGGGDWSKDRILPDCITALKNENTIYIRNPMATRPWQHVLEPLSGYLWLGSLLHNGGIEYSGAWNFGPENKDIVDVEEFVKNIIFLWGHGHYKIEQNSKFHEAGLLKLDISKSNQYLNWKPIFNLSQALKITLSWYKSFYNNVNMFDYTLSQINYYTNLAKKKSLNWIQ